MSRKYMENIEQTVKSIWFNGANGDECVKSTDENRLVYKSFYMGDRTDEYVCQIAKDGTEICRHNCRYIATIEWVIPECFPRK